jgi:hypothetical protein
MEGDHPCRFMVCQFNGQTKIIGKFPELAGKFTSKEYLKINLSQPGTSWGETASQ